MKYCIVSIMIICSSFLSVSCTDKALEDSLKLSGENRAELERVLFTLQRTILKKKKAAEFLDTEHEMVSCRGFSVYGYILQASRSFTGE